jgi:hypothetical protein
MQERVMDADAPSLCLSPAKGREDLKSNPVVFSHAQALPENEVVNFPFQTTRRLRAVGACRRRARSFLKALLSTKRIKVFQ